MAFESTIDIYDTPQLRYDKLRKEFGSKYLERKAWNYEFGSKEIVQAYHDLLEFLERTEFFRDLTKSLYTDIPVDNVHLVLRDIPFTQKQHDDLLDYVVAGKPPKPSIYSHEDKLRRIKEFCRKQKERGLFVMEMKSGTEIMRDRDARRGVVHEHIENVSEDDGKKCAFDKEDERTQRQNEILSIRQNVYSQLCQGEKVFMIMKMFKRKVEKFLERYKADLSYGEEKKWKDKVIITEKAVRRHTEKIKATKHSKKDEILAPTVKKMFDELKVEHASIKTCDQKLIDANDENITKKISEVMKVTIDQVLNDLKMDKIVFDGIKEELESLKKVQQ